MENKEQEIFYDIANVVAKFCNEVSKTQKKSNSSESEDNSNESVKED